MNSSSRRLHSRIAAVVAGARALLLVAFVAVFAISLAVVSYAQGSAKDVALPANLPVAALSPTSISDQAIATLSRAIGAYQANRFGVTDASFSQTREFRAGDEVVDVVPGANGVCIVIRKASTCGAAGVDSHVLGLYLIDARTRRATGAGITDDSVSFVRLALNRASIVLPVKTGTFVLPASAGLHEPAGRVVPLQASTG